MEESSEEVEGGEEDGMKPNEGESEEEMEAEAEEE